MKRTLPLIAALALPACLASAAAMADPWEAYARLMDHYYQADGQPAKSITCHISSSALDDMARLLKQKSVTLKDNLQDFSVTVEKGKGISFTAPDVEIASGPPEHSEAVKKGSALIISGIKEVVSGVFDSMLARPKEKMKNLAVTSNGDTTVVSYDDGTEKVETTYAGDSDETKETLPNAVLNSKSRYISLNGKLAVSDSAMHSSEGPEKLEGTMAVTYQQLGENYFPAKIVSDIKFGDSANAQHVEVNFQDCKTAD